MRLTQTHTNPHTNTNPHIHTHKHTQTHTHTSTHTHTHTHKPKHTHTHTIPPTRQHTKMADEEDQQVENAFDILVSITEKSGNLRKDLKQDILQSVSILRKVFAKMKTAREQVHGK